MRIAQVMHGWPAEKRAAQGCTWKPSLVHCWPRSRGRHCAPPSTPQPVRGCATGSACMPSGTAVVDGGTRGTVMSAGQPGARNGVRRRPRPSPLGLSAGPHRRRTEPTRTDPARLRRPLCSRPQTADLRPQRPVQRPAPAAWDPRPGPRPRPVGPWATSRRIPMDSGTADSSSEHPHADVVARIGPPTRTAGRDVVSLLSPPGRADVCLGRCEHRPHRTAWFRRSCPARYPRPVGPVSHASSIIPTKGPDRLLRAFRALRADARLTIAGHSPASHSSEVRG